MLLNQTSDGAVRCPQNGVSQRISESVEFMEEHLDRPLRVAELAAIAEVSPSYYFALFKQQAGCAPMVYLTRLRITRACHLLEATSLSVKEIAGMLGYDDPLYFSRVFKTAKGVAPSRYRLANFDLDRDLAVGCDRSRHLRQNDQSRQRPTGVQRVSFFDAVSPHI